MLPVGTEPLELADGTLIDPIDGSVVPTQEEEFVEVPNYQEVQRDYTARRRRISDLPLPPKEMNAISVIISYTLFGLADKDIATVLSIPTEQVERIKLSDHYKELMDTFVENIAVQDADHVRSLFSQQSIIAAQKITNLLNSNSPHVAMSAAKDVLDRAGHRPVDVINHKHTMEGGLTIRHIRKSEVEPLTIDVTPDGDSL